MANPVMKFYTTTDSKLSSLEVKDGRLIFVNDTRKIYLDLNSTRTEYSQIIVLLDEAQRLATIPVTGFYFVKETNVLWRYEGEWIQLTTPPRESVVFLDELPETGVENTLYILDDKIYKWNGINYVNLGGSLWGTF